MRKQPGIVLTLLAAVLLLTLAGGCSAKVKATRHLQRADRYFDAGKYAQAEIEYLNTLQLEHTNSRAIGQLGRIYFEQGRSGFGYALLTNASAMNPADLDLRVKIASLDLAIGQRTQALEQIAFVLDRMPTNADAPVLLAESVNSRTNLDQVRLRLQKLAGSVGETAPLMLANGVLLLREGKAKDAETAFKRALELDPKSSSASFALGNLRWALNDLEGADAALKSAADLAPPRSSRRLSYADFKIKTGHLEDGKKVLSDISTQVPDYLPAWIRQAEISLAEKQFTNCASLLNQALARDANNYEALILRARLLLAQRDAAGAISVSQRTAKLAPKSAQAQYYLALAFLQNNDSAKAIKCLSQAVTLDPNYPEATFALAGFNIVKGNTADAVASLTKFTKQRPGISEGHLLLADAYQAMSDPDRAAEVYRHTMELFPKSPQVPFLLGMLLAGQKKFAEARQAFQKSLELAPDALATQEQLLDLDLSQKDYAAALDRAEKQLQHKPVAESHLLVAKVQMARATDALIAERAKNPTAATNVTLAGLPDARAAADRAEAELLKAIELNPDLALSYYSLAQLLVASGRHQQALDRLNSMVARTNDVAAFMQMGMIYDELKNYPAARDAYEKALAIKTNFSPVLNNLAYLYCEHLHQLDRAYELADRGYQLMPTNAVIADTLGWVLYRETNYVRALALIQESARVLTADPEVQFHLGMTQYMLGEEEAARAALVKSLQSTKEFPDKEEGRRRLEFLSQEIKPGDAVAVANLEKRVQANPNDPVAADRLAAVYEQNGAVEKAARTYELLLRQNPNNAEVMGRLAALYAGPLNDKVKALALAKEAHNLAPGDPSISLTLGRLVYQQQDPDYNWALSLIQEASRKLPGQPGLLYDLAWACYSAGRPDEALEHMQAAVQSGTNFSRVDDANRFLKLVAAAQSPAQAIAAQDLARQVLKTDSNSVPAKMALALAMQQQGNFVEARQLYEQILAANRLFTPAAREYAILCMRHFADDPKAYDLAVKAREAFPDDPELARALGILAFNRKDDKRAAQLLAQCAETSNNDGELLYYLGMAQYRLNRRAESKVALRQALTLNVPSKLASEAERILAELK